VLLRIEDDDDYEDEEHQQQYDYGSRMSVGWWLRLR
jgi:hypothetical protein